MSKTVGVAYDLKSDYVLKDSDPGDYNAELDYEETIDDICAALSSGGHCPVKLGSSRKIIKNISCLKKIDIVFNICEGIGGRNRESEMPVILEMLNIPYVGADGLTLGLTLDKTLTKKILQCESILTPRFIEVRNPETIKKNGLRYPLIVKPCHEGSSKGISEKSIVNNFKELRQQTDWLIKRYRQPALVEEFIEGMEFTVPVIGNNPPQALPVVQIEIENKLNLGRLFYTNAHIHSNCLKYRCPAKISPQLKQKLQTIAVRTYQAVECRDFGRVDFRVDNNGRPYVLEINPLPALSILDVFNIAPQQIGMTYKEIINRILNAALKRTGLCD
ncbi:MAG: ATP-grasp domain-containing protein [Candidatus Omnitrophota bacterium]